MLSLLYADSIEYLEFSQMENAINTIVLVTSKVVARYIQYNQA
jgi:hypothetical protein